MGNLNRPAAALLRRLPEGRLLPQPVWQRRHRGIVALAFAQAVWLVVFALFRGYHLADAVLEGGVVALPALPALVPALGRVRRAAAATTSLTFASASLVHLSGGVTEAHFYFFVMIGVVALYQSWVPFGIALLVTVLHHGLLGTLQPTHVFGTPQAREHPWLWALIHGGFVLAASITHLVSWRYNEQQGLRDALTGLPNRTQFNESSTAALVGNAGAHSVLMVDLDDFKAVNERWGSDVGDRVLQTAAERLRGCLRLGDVLARLDGDEFAILVAGDRTAGAEVGQRLLDALADPLVVDDQGLLVTASAGIATAEPGGVECPDADVLLRNAGLALHAAKANARGRLVVYEDEMSRAWRERAQLAEQLRSARASGQLEVHYQATVQLPNGSVSGYEALVRWRHPERGLVPPLDFVALAEETGFITELGEFVLDEAVRQAVEWGCDGELDIAVNVSPRQLLDESFPTFVAEVLVERGLPPHRLILEVTEGVLVHDHLSVAAQLDRLRAIGVRVAIDDFGTGYSSLSYLRRLPADLLKIDRSFVCEVDEDPSALALVAAILDLARSLGLDVIAEGVETREQAEALTFLGCPRVQGFLYARPQPASELRLAQPTVAAVPAPRETVDAARSEPASL